MKLFLVVSAFVVTVITAIVDGNSNLDVPLGYHLVAVGALLAGALWRNDEFERRHYYVAQRVYESLASGPMTSEDLVKQLCGDRYLPADWVSACKETIGRMLSEGAIVMENGLIGVPGNLNSAIKGDDKNAEQAAAGDPVKHPNLK